MSLVWRDQLSVGNDAIDADHKRLIKIINEVEESLAAKNDGKLTQLLNDLSEYSQTHFDHEERIAQAVGYERASHLHGTHVALLHRLEAFKTEVDKSWTQEAKDHFCTLLREWLVNHVIKDDMRLKPDLIKHPPNLDA